jgi:hypothetical protein
MKDSYLQVSLLNDYDYYFLIVAIEEKVSSYIHRIDFLTVELCRWKPDDGDECKFGLSRFC